MGFYLHVNFDLIFQCWINTKVNTAELWLFVGTLFSLPNGENLKLFGLERTRPAFLTSPRLCGLSLESRSRLFQKAFGILATPDTTALSGERDFRIRARDSCFRQHFLESVGMSGQKQPGTGEKFKKAVFMPSLSLHSGFDAVNSVVDIYK